MGMPMIHTGDTALQRRENPIPRLRRPTAEKRPAVARNVRPRIAHPEIAVVCDFYGDRQLKLRLAAVPEFETARHIGEETFANGVIPRDLFSSVVGFSVELKLINQVLDAGEELDGLTIAAPHLLRLADAPGFDGWYETISSRAN